MSGTSDVSLALELSHNDRKMHVGKIKEIKKILTLSDIIYMYPKVEVSLLINTGMCIKKG